MPLFSIIVPIYNVEKYLSKCLDSLVMQTWKDFEVILVNDGTQDNCQMIIDDYCDQEARFKSIIKVNGGLSDARNAGIKEAVGDYILCVDPDDTFRYDGLSLLADHINETQADYIAFDMKFIWEEVDKEVLVKGCILDEINKHALLISTPSACNKVIKRELFTYIEFPFKKRYEDLATTPILLGYAKKVSYLNEALYLYLQREGSIIYTFNDKMNDIYSSLERVKDYYKQMNWYENSQKEIEFLFIEHIMLHHCRRMLNLPNGKIEIIKAIDYMRKSFPEWRKNRYMPTLPRSNRLLITLFAYRQIGLIQWIRKGRAV